MTENSDPAVSPGAISEDGGLAETERLHSADCRRQEARRMREAEALQATFLEAENASLRADLQRMTEDRDRAIAAGVYAAHETEELRADLQRERLAHDNTVDQRDNAQEWADRLSYTYFGVEDIGEHSNINNPWRNAVERIGELKERAAQAEADLQRMREERDEFRRRVDLLAAAARESAGSAEAYRGHYYSERIAKTAAESLLRDRTVQLERYGKHDWECELNREPPWCDALVGGGVRALSQDERATIKASYKCTCGLAAVITPGHEK